MICYLSHCLVGCKIPWAHPGATRRAAWWQRFQRNEQLSSESERAGRTLVSSNMTMIASLHSYHRYGKRGQVDTMEGGRYLQGAWSKRATSLHEETLAQRSCKLNKQCRKQRGSLSNVKCRCPFRIPKESTNVPSEKDTIWTPAPQRALATQQRINSSRQVKRLQFLSP